MKEEIELAKRYLDEMEECIENEEFAEVSEKAGIVKTLMKSVELSGHAHIDYEIEFDEMLEEIDESDIGEQFEERDES